MDPHARELLAINRAIVGAVAYDEILRLVVEKTAAITQASACMLVLSQKDGLARVARSVGLDPAQAAQLSAPLDERIDRELCRMLGVETPDRLLAVPVIGREGLLGILAVYWDDPLLSHETRDEELLAALADQAAIALDNAERVRQLRDSLNEKEVLLQEVHHRVKNNLQVIASLIGMQLRKLESEAAREALEECRMRVLAIALIHAKLYQTHNFARVPFYEYIQSLTGDIFQATGSHCAIELELEIDRVAMPVDIAIPCGLLVNELITNALKHAFPHDRAGKIRISLAVSDGRAVLTVQDDGVGFPAGFEIARAQTLGLQLVAMLAEQLDATLGIDSAPGAQVRVVFTLETET